MIQKYIVSFVVGVAIALAVLFIPKIFLASAIVLLAANELALLKSDGSLFGIRCERVAIAVGGLLVVLFYYIFAR